MKERWNKLTAAEWSSFAQAWLAELRGEATESDSDISGSVVLMNFTASAEHQWRFILASTIHAQSDEELGRIAAGPLEHLLGHHGDEYIDLVEQQAEADTTFARMLTGAWKYQMSDEVWERIQKIQSRVERPLEDDET